MTAPRRPYQTRQKANLLSLLQSSAGRPVSAQMLQQQLVAEGVSVALPTVYRQLDALSRQGVVRRLSHQDGPRRALYRYVEPTEQAGQLSLLCRGCGRIQSVHCGQLDHLRDHLAGAHGFSVDAKATVIQGICDRCEPAESEAAK